MSENMTRKEEARIPVERTDFKSDGGRHTCPVGSTPTLFRHFVRELTVL